MATPSRTNNLKHNQGPLHVRLGTEPGRPWFDNKHKAAMDRASAEECLQIIARDPQIVQAVNKALTKYEESQRVPKYVGPWRVQEVRRAIVEALQADPVF